MVAQLPTLTAEGARTGPDGARRGGDDVEIDLVGPQAERKRTAGPQLAVKLQTALEKRHQQYGIELL